MASNLPRRSTSRNKSSSGLRRVRFPESSSRLGLRSTSSACHKRASTTMIVHLIDGTYELFRHFYGIRRMQKGDPPFGAVRGVLQMVLQMIETGATHIGVATDHVIESFRNELWDGYKTGA